MIDHYIAGSLYDNSCTCSPRKLQNVVNLTIASELIIDFMTLIFPSSPRDEMSTSHHSAGARRKGSLPQASLLEAACPVGPV